MKKTDNATVLDKNDVKINNSSQNNKENLILNQMNRLKCKPLMSVVPLLTFEQEGIGLLYNNLNMAVVICKTCIFHYGQSTSDSICKIFKWMNSTSLPKTVYSNSSLMPHLFIKENIIGYARSGINTQSIRRCYLNDTL